MGRRVELFGVEDFASSDEVANYDVALDGQRFLMVTRGRSEVELVVVDNFFTELEERVSN
jgi:hypothetical protein